jgi:hypothetical protein
VELAAFKGLVRNAIFGLLQDVKNGLKGLEKLGFYFLEIVGMAHSCGEV